MRNVLRNGSGLGVGGRLSLLMIACVGLLGAAFAVMAVVLSDFRTSQTAAERRDSLDNIQQAVVTNRVEAMARARQSLTRNRDLKAALFNSDAAAVRDAVGPTFTRLEAGGVVDAMLVADADGEVVFRGGGLTGTEAVIARTLDTGKAVGGLTRVADGLAAVRTVPVIDRADLVGVAVLLTSAKTLAAEGEKAAGKALMWVDTAGAIVGRGGDMASYADAQDMPTSGGSTLIEHEQHIIDISRVAVTGVSGDIVGSVAAMQDVTAAVRDARRFWGLFAAIGVLLGALVVGTGWFVLRRTIARPLSALTGDIVALADGETDLRGDHGQRRDEIGDIGRAVETLRQAVITRQRLEAESEATRVRDKAVARRTDDATRSFQEAAQEAATGLTNATGRIDESLAHMTEIITRTRDKASSLSAAAEQSSSNLATVSSAAEQLAGSIQEIGQQAWQTSSIAQDLATKSKSANQQVANLTESVNKIGEVVSLIEDIAEQTNLLALNATIEAARAGEAGKGFAVVANEVKSLANQTQKATDQITEKIRMVQDQTASTVQGIEAITSGVADIDQAAGAISSAIDEQRASTDEITRNMAEASTSARDVAASVDAVRSDADASAESLDAVREASKEVADIETRMNDNVSRFVTELQAAREAG